MKFKLQLLLKRIFDIIFSLSLLVILFPLFGLIGILIKAETEGPVFFLQERIGRNQKRFQMFKFRSMIENAINMGTGISTGKNDPRITRVGAFLRKTSIDELPQLINVLIGDMSIVGPRPAIDLHLKQYKSEDYKRFKMRPGITGLAQVSGRKRLPLIRRLKYDTYYVNNFSLLLDLKIIVKTITVVLTKRNIYHKE